MPSMDYGLIVQSFERHCRYSRRYHGYESMTHSSVDRVEGEGGNEVDERDAPNVEIDGLPLYVMMGHAQRN